MKKRVNIDNSVITCYFDKEFKENSLNWYEILEETNAFSLYLFYSILIWAVFTFSFRLTGNSILFLMN